MSNSITKHRRTAFKRQNGRCHYCGLPMWLKQPTELTARYSLNEGTLSRLRCTAEHLVARQDGGPNTRSNIVAACIHCNMTRHRKNSPPDPTIYRLQVRHSLRAGKGKPHAPQTATALGSHVSLDSGLQDVSSVPPVHR